MLRRSPHRPKAVQAAVDVGIRLVPMSDSGPSGHWRKRHRLRSRLHCGDAGSDLDFQVFGMMTTRSAPTTTVSGGIIVPK